MGVFFDELYNLANGIFPAKSGSLICWRLRTMRINVHKLSFDFKNIS